MTGGVSVPTIHASAVSVDDRGVLIRGASGAGKSSLAMSLLYAEGDRAILIADDRVRLEARDGALMASPPARLAGLIEIRGQGILRRPHIGEVPVALVVDLLPLEDCPRYPEPDELRIRIGGVEMPRIVIAIGAVDGPARVAFALAESAVPRHMDVSVRSG